MGLSMAEPLCAAVCTVEWAQDFSKGLKYSGKWKGAREGEKEIPEILLASYTDQGS